MIDPKVNRELWKSESAFEDFQDCLEDMAELDTLTTEQAVALAQRIKAVLQDEEKNGGKVTDPLFFYYFALSNYRLIQLGEDDPPIPDLTRKSFETALTLDRKNPTLTPRMLEFAQEAIMEIGRGLG